MFLLHNIGISYQSGPNLEALKFSISMHDFKTIFDDLIILKASHRNSRMRITK